MLLLSLAFPLLFGTADSVAVRDIRVAELPRGGKCITAVVPLR